MLEKSAQNKASGEAGAQAKAGTAAPKKPAGGNLSPAVRQKLEQISQGLDMLQEDTSVPRNIRRGAEEAKKVLWDETLALDVRKSKAISTLDELANDPNIPLYGRTLIWSIMSQLEPVA